MSALGYEVQWEEESTVVSCTHTLTEAATNSEVNIWGYYYSLWQAVAFFLSNAISFTALCDINSVSLIEHISLNQIGFVCVHILVPISIHYVCTHVLII